MQTLFADDENKPAMVTIKQEVPDNYEEDEMLTSQDDESIVTTESEIDEGHGESNRAKSPVHKRRKVRASHFAHPWFKLLVLYYSNHPLILQIIF